MESLFLSMYVLRHNYSRTCCNAWTYLAGALYNCLLNAAALAGMEIPAELQVHAGRDGDYPG